MNISNQKIFNWLNEDAGKVFLFNNQNLNSWIAQHHEALSLDKKILFICEDTLSAKSTFDSLNSLELGQNLLLIGPECEPFDEYVYTENNLNIFLEGLHQIQNNLIKCIVTDYKTAILKLAPQDFIKTQGLKISVYDELPPNQLKQKLTQMGLNQTEVSQSPGTFSSRGEIFDICLNENASFRLLYFDDLVEHIFPINPETYKADRDSPLETLTVPPVFKTLFHPDFSQNLRLNLAKPAPKFKIKNEVRNKIFENINNSEIFDSSFHYTPLFFNEHSHLFDYLGDNSIVITQNYSSSIQNLSIYKDTLDETLELNNDDANSRVLISSVDQIFNFECLKQIPQKQIDISSLQLENSENLDLTQSINSDESSLYAFFKVADKKELLKKLFSFLQTQVNTYKKVHFFYVTDTDKFNHFLDIFKIPRSKVVITQFPLESSFFKTSEEAFYLSEEDLFGKKPRKKRKRQSKNIFAEQIATLKAGDFIVHKKFGIGIFCGIENLVSGGHANDYVVLEYKDKDKVYVPVYNLELVQKYADSNAECKVADLKSKSFDKSKAKARSAVKQLAFDVIQLQAERAAFKGFKFNEPGEDYQKFSESFPYHLTEDQFSAVESVLEDMCSYKPMDRLICGDVGFGKTEVAMRAAFKAVEDGKQVALLVPTTILSLQHYMNFKERFKEFAIKIDYLSRFQTTKKTNEIFQSIEEGKTDILIGTHKILSSKINFSNLGLVIIDEEHRFGVGQKEKLKLLKKNTDFLTLTATPIPRTLQLSFLGIKDLSLIQTPPPKRQSISSYMVRDNDKTIKNAIENELSRDGQVFVIHNKVQDIEILVSRIRQLVPQAKINFAHGQMNEKELEKRINDFYQNKFNVLIATTIVESGIDIPTANTMIINNSHAFGLAQLHQLRGRIGRSSRKAFCYFLIPSHGKLSVTATKRLEALQRYSSIGAGFALASSDLELRGAGNILGGEQSGHIQSIGLELYMEMLKEAISEVKGEESLSFDDRADIQVFFPTFIPKSFISDQNVRLKYYKTISNSSELEELHSIKEEIQDIFGKLPQETINLIDLVGMKALISKTPITSLSIGEKKIIIKLDQQKLAANESMRNHLLETTLHKTDLFKIKPNQSIICHYKQADSSTSLTNLQSILSLLFL